jgi:hypothetical protein
MSSTNINKNVLVPHRPRFDQMNKTGTVSD